MHIELHTRHFFCHTPGCGRWIFTERLPGLTPAYGRRTQALAEALRWVGWKAGGTAGAQLAEHLRLPGSADSLLRGIRRGGVPALPTAHVVGVDDFAFHKGTRYGTLVVDLEAHPVIDLLPERSTDSWADWLRAHPAVTVVSSDRVEVYTACTPPARA